MRVLFSNMRPILSLDLPEQCSRNWSTSEKHQRPKKVLSATPFVPEDQQLEDSVKRSHLENKQVALQRLQEFPWDGIDMDLEAYESRTGGPLPLVSDDELTPHQPCQPEPLSCDPLNFTGYEPYAPPVPIFVEWKRVQPKTVGQHVREVRGGVSPWDLSAREELCQNELYRTALYNSTVLAFERHYPLNLQQLERSSWSDEEDLEEEGWIDE